jgi:hypothetical protein
MQQQIDQLERGLGSFIPDSYETCDGCLAVKYGLERAVSCCGCCNSDDGFTEESVIKALRLAESAKR